MVAKDPRIDPQADGNRTELHHQTIEQLVPQLLHGLRLEVELAGWTFRPAHQAVNDLSAVSCRSEVAALGRRNRKEPEDEPALVRDEIVRLTADRGVVRDDVRRGIAARHPYGGECPEGAILSYEDRIAAGALDLGQDGPRSVAKTHAPA